MNDYVMTSILLHCLDVESDGGVVFRVEKQVGRLREKLKKRDADYQMALFPSCLLDCTLYNEELRRSLCGYE